MNHVKPRGLKRKESGAGQQGQLPLATEEESDRSKQRKQREPFRFRFRFCIDLTRPLFSLFGSGKNQSTDASAPNYAGDRGAGNWFLSFFLGFLCFLLFISFFLEMECRLLLDIEAAAISDDRPRAGGYPHRIPTGLASRAHASGKSFGKKRG